MNIQNLRWDGKLTFLHWTCCDSTRICLCIQCLWVYVCVYRIYVSNATLRWHVATSTSFLRCRCCNNTMTYEPPASSCPLRCHLHLNTLSFHITVCIHMHFSVLVSMYEHVYSYIYTHSHCMYSWRLNNFFRNIFTGAHMLWCTCHSYTYFHARVIATHALMRVS